jgi:hypothetical protein
VLPVGKVADGMEAHPVWRWHDDFALFVNVPAPKASHALTAERVGITVNAVFAQLEFKH